MSLDRTRLRVLLAALVALVAFILPAALPRTASADDWTLTGSGIRVKKIAFVDINVYAISHYVKQAPPAKSKQAVIDLDAGKKFVWTMKRDVDQDKIQNALKEAFAMNGYADGGKIGQFIGAFKGDLKENGAVTIIYDADKKETSVSTGSGSAAVGGVDFMKAVWSIWFGKIDQPSLGDQLISKLP
jgi:Chalcone isomerase-like